ncbi:hypothetical protein DT23_02925 [Thioclava indica]|uniref:Uncharacterized protein n=1 Tax=Thioclava indica TaxID=1353528 RepID=A0A074JS26_9RHOB|nr:hypothetical protein DT23_02925 [Thioclava indica]
MAQGAERANVDDMARASQRLQRLLPIGCKVCSAFEHARGLLELAVRGEGHPKGVQVIGGLAIKGHEISPVGRPGAAPRADNSDLTSRSE